MPRIVMKFGGTSVADLERIRHVASLVEAETAAGNEVAVVVSAMSGETNRLVSLVDALDADRMDGAEERGGGIDDEYDSVVASGEQVTSGLLAIALRRRGIPAPRSSARTRRTARRASARSRAAPSGRASRTAMWRWWRVFRG